MTLSPVQSESPECAAIRTARLTQTQAIAQGDIARVAAYWTEDITIRRGLGHPIMGKAEAIQTLLPSPNGPTVVYQRTADEIAVSEQWPLAYETGTWSGHLGDASGPAVIAGRYSAQWVKRGDTWLIRAEIFVALTCEGIGCDLMALP